MGSNVFLPIFGALIGLPNLAIAIYFHRKSIDSKSWPSTLGVVVRSEVVILRTGEFSC